MAASFKNSSHSKCWLLPRKEVLKSNALDIVATSRDEILKLRLYFVEMMHHMGKELKLRQRVISSAVVFFKRFYLKRSFGEYDPRIIAITLLFLAAKVEETYLNAKFFVKSVKEDELLRPLYKALNITTETLLRFEFQIMEALSFNLIVFHPYRPITRILEGMGEKRLLQMAWSIANDSYRTDLCLEHAPAKIAVAVIYLSMILNDYDQKARDSFLQQVRISGEGGPEVDEVLEISGRLVELYRYYSENGKGDKMSASKVLNILEKLRKLSPEK